MGRLSLVIVLLVAACDEKKTNTNQGRSEAVSGSAPVITSAAPSSTASSAPPRGALCSKEARTFPASPTVKVVDAAGTETTARVDLKGNFTWVSFWAAWCGPCKEEMPRLRSWKSKLVAQGVKFELAMVSLDDDDRQLQRELAAQTDPAAKKSLWLPDGPLRTAVLTPLKMKSSPELPAHALIDPDGKVKCFIEGAIEDRDFDEVQKLVR